MHEELDVDPSDDRPTFLQINLGGFIIESLIDVDLFWEELDRFTMKQSEAAGFIIYPLVEL